MKYDEFREQSHFNQDELLALAHGRLIDDPPDGFRARLPTPPMLMIDRVEEMSRDGRVSWARAGRHHAGLSAADLFGHRSAGESLAPGSPPGSII